MLARVLEHATKQFGLELLWCVSMARSGLYQVVYLDGEPPSGVFEVLLAVGKGWVFGSDPFGGVYVGRILAPTRPCGRFHFLDMACHLSPDDEPATHVETGEPGSDSIPILGLMCASENNQVTTLMVGDRLVDVEINYLGPLPG